MKHRYHAACATSGGVWAAIAYAIGQQSLPRAIIWGGIAVSPLIGLAVGAIYRPSYKLPRTAQIAMSLLTLYIAATLFGLAVGLFDAVRGLPGGLARGQAEVVYQGIVGTLWGITFTG